MTHGDGGKGSNQRPTDHKKWSSGYDNIKWTKEEDEEVIEEEKEDDAVETENSSSDEKDEEEEQELIEIEIDGVTYCTENDENGFIYLIDEDGNVGEATGYLKDGEPFFN